MAMRAKEIDPGGPLDANSADQFKVGSANQMASMLAEWDIKAALPVLKARVERCARVVQAGQETERRFHGMEEGIASLTRLRTKAGDPEALERLRRLGPHRHSRPVRLRPDRDVRALVEQSRPPGHDRRGRRAVRRPEIALESVDQFRRALRFRSGCGTICSAVPCSA